MDRFFIATGLALSMLVLAACATPEPLPLDPEAQVPPPRGDD